MTKPVMLVILDGFGWREETADNAVAQANKPNFDRLWASCPHAFLHTCGRDVGLPRRADGQFRGRAPEHRRRPGGDAGTAAHRQRHRGRLAGRRTRRCIALIATLKQTGGTCHLIGLVSPGGVHAHQDHAVALAQILHAAGIPVVVHAFTDGRDTPPQAGAGYMCRISRPRCRQTRPSPPSAAATTRWTATSAGSACSRPTTSSPQAKGAHFPTAEPRSRPATRQNVTDEFIKPAVIGDYAGMKDGDAMLCFNFRADRVREILAALLDPAFDGFPPHARRNSPPPSA